MGSKAGGLGTIVGVESGFWVVECGEWKTKRVIFLYGIIALALGWHVVEIWNNNAYGLEESPSYLASWLSLINI